MERFRFGVMGCGNIANTFVKAVQAEGESAEVCAAASREPEKAKAWAAERGIPKGYTYDDLLADPEIDAVYIALPNTLHAEWTKKAAQAGKHILCEKPLAANAAEAVEMVEGARRAGVLLLEAFVYRFHPQTRKLRQLLDEGRIGALRHLYATFSYRLGGENWRRNIRARADLAGGALMDIGCYPISFARFAFNAEPTGVRATLHQPADCEVDFAYQGLLEFEGGMAATHASMSASGGVYARLVGEKGTILVPLPYHPHDADQPIIVQRAGSAPEEFRLGGPNGFALTADHLAHCARTGEAPMCDATDGVANMKAIDAVRAAAQNGRRQAPAVST